MSWLDEVADKALAGEPPTRDEALKVLRSGDDELMDVIAAAFRVRRKHFGRKVKLNYLVSIKSGLCPEDCFYCSQRAGSAADVLKYTWLKPDEVLATAAKGVQAGARRVCMVASGRGPNDREVANVAGMIEAFKQEHPDVEVCACLGLLSEGQAQTSTPGLRSLNAASVPEIRSMSLSVGPRPLATRQTRCAPPATPASADAMTSSGFSQVYLSTSAAEPARCEQ